MSIIASPYFMGQAMDGLDVPTPHEVLSPELPEGTQQERMGVLYDHLARWVAGTEHPVVYAGDCVSIIGVLAGLERRGVLPTLIFFDAHGDFNTWETTPSGFIGGMPLAMVVGRGEQTIVDSARLTPVPEDRVILVDGRDLDPGEDTAIERSGIGVLSVVEVSEATLPPGPLYLHIDGDVVDPDDMPAMNYPAPGGPSLAEVAAAVERTAATGRVAAFSVSSWNPQLPGADRASAATTVLASPFIGND